MLNRLKKPYFFVLVTLLGAAPTAFGVVALGPAGSETLLQAEANQPDIFSAFGRWGSCVQWHSPSPAQVAIRLFDNTTYIHTQLTQSDAYSTLFPAAAASDDYLLVVHATVPPVSGGGTAVLTAVLYDEQGNLLDGEILDTNSSSRPYLELEVAVDPNNGNFLVVWREEVDTANDEIWGKLVSVVGGQLAGPSNPSLYGSGYQGERIDVAYAERVEPPRSGILYERFIVVYSGFAGALAAFVEPQLGTAVASDILVGQGEDPRIASAGSECLVVWEDGSTIQSRRVFPSSAFPEPAEQVTAAGQWPDVAASKSEYLVVFREPVSPDPEEIRGRYLGFDGALMATEFTAVPAFETLGAPALSSDGKVYLVAYTKANGNSPPSSPVDVHYSRISPGVFTFFDGDVDDASDLTRGVAFGDWRWPWSYPDLYVANTSSTMNEVFENETGLLSYTGAAGGLDFGNGQGIAHADVDNDGSLDMLLTNSNQINSLYLTAPSPIFHDFLTPDPADIDDGAHDSRSVAMADYDGDGWIDFAVANKSARNSLLHNEGGNFSDQSADLGLVVANSEGVSFADFDGDGDPDLYVGNAGSANRLYLNDNGSFSLSDEEAGAYGLADTGSARSVTWVDFDGDGDLDLFISKYNEANSLYRNDGNAFVDISVSSGVADTGRGESACFADMDLDGDPDLFLANFNDPDRLYRNDGGVFTEVGSTIGLESDGPSLGAAWGDVDQDGDPDLIVGGYGADNRVYLNEMQSANDWLQLDLAGTTSNASAIGARVTVDDGSTTLTQWVGTGSGYLSQNDLGLIFGLGETAPALVDVTVEWPSGLTEQFANILSNIRFTLNEGQGTATAVSPPALGVFKLHGNVPNPFNPRTSIAFELAQTGPVELSLFDLRGRRVVQLISEVLSAGSHEVDWDGRDADGIMVASGTYLYRLRTPAMTASRRMTLVK